MPTKRRTFKEGCKWHLTFRGEKFIVGSDEELDSTIFSKADISKTPEAIFYSKSPLEESIDNIERIKQDIKDSAKPFRGTFDVEELEWYIPGSMGVSKYIGFRDLVTQFNQKAWEDSKINEYLQGGRRLADGSLQAIETPGGKKITQIGTEQEARNLIKQEEGSWAKLQQYGEDIHSILENVMNGIEPVNKNLPDNVFKDTVEQAKQFRDFIKDKYGKNAKIYTELPIKSKNLSDETLEALKAVNKDSINGRIDLLIIDEAGKGHLFDYKVSRKGITVTGNTNSQESMWDETRNDLGLSEKTWHSTKKLAASYQLALYQDMLSQYGIKVLDASIIPIKIDLEYNNSNNEFEPTNITGGEIGYTHMVVNPHKRKGGTIKAKVDSMFKQEISVNSNQIIQLDRIYSTFFPANSIIAQQENRRQTIAYYKTRPDIVAKLKPGDYKYDDGNRYRLYKKSTDKTTKYFKTEKELDKAIEQYIIDSTNRLANKNEDIATIIEGINNGSSTIEDLLNLTTNDNRQFMNSQFSKYINGNWNFLSNSELNRLGIFIFTKGNKSEVVLLSDKALRTTINLGQGDSLLGKTKSNKFIDSTKIMSAMQGNMNLMKAMIYISQNQDLFKKYKIANIRTINPWMGTEVTELNSSIIYNFNSLLDENKVTEVKKATSELFMDDREALVQQASELIDNLETDILGNIDPQVQLYSQKWFETAIESFKRRYRNNINFNGEYQDTPIWNAYRMLLEGYQLTRGHKSYTEIDKSDWIQGKVYELSGLKMSSGQFSASTNIRELSKIIDEYAKEVRKQVQEIGFPLQKAFIELYKKHGTGAKIFNTWFSDRERLIFKDPNSKEFDGDPESRKCLNLVLKILAKLKNPNLKTDEDFENAKNDPEYYECPLMEAAFSRQLKNIGFFQTIKNKWKEQSNLTKGLFMDEEVNIEEYVQQVNKLYNKFDITGEKREERLRQYGYGTFETDVESIINAALVSYIKSNVSKEYIPLISALRTSLDYIDRTEKNGGMAKIKENYDLMVKSKFYGESIIDPKLQPLMKWLNCIKGTFTTLTLALNVPSFLRESLQGLLKGISRAHVELLPGVTNKTYIDGLTEVIQNIPETEESISKLQQLNAIYGMANQSLSQLAQSRRVNWAHINHWGKDTMFLPASSPDFMHRLSILVAKMMGDKCWDAHSIDADGRLVYNFKKDARFSDFITGKTDSKDYLKQKSLYLTMIDEFNKEGFRNKDGSLLNADNLDALPQAYTRTEGQSIKNYADFLYGHYDDESKSLLCDMMFGSIALQYKTFLTAMLEQWTIKEGKYNTEQLKQQFDSDGNELYLKFYEDENGIAHKDTISKSDYEALSKDEKKACRLYFDYDANPMKGITQELISFTKAISSMDQETFNKYWKDPTSRAILKIFLYDEALMAFMTIMATFIFGSLLGVEGSDKAVRKELKQRGIGPNLAYNVIAGSMTDSRIENIIGSFTQTPPLISSIKRFSNSTFKLVTGKESPAYWTTQNVGALRQFQGMVKMIEQEENK